MIFEEQSAANKVSEACSEEIHISKTMWKSFIDLIPQTAGKYNFAATLKAIEVCQEYRNIAKEILPEEALKSTFPKSYKDNTLTIGALNSGWAEKVQMNKHRIHQSLKKKFGEHAIKNIRIEMAEKLPTDRLESA